jgi:hypothetical protein
VCPAGAAGVEPPRPAPSILAGVALASGSAIAAQVALTRVFAISLGLNAFATVVASAIAPILAMQIGFSALIGLAALAYAVAFVAIGRDAAQPPVPNTRSQNIEETPNRFE